MKMWWVAQELLPGVYSGQRDEIPIKTFCFEIFEPILPHRSELSLSQKGPCSTLSIIKTETRRLLAPAVGVFGVSAAGYENLAQQNNSQANPCVCISSTH